MSPTGFESAIPVGDRLQILALDRSATGIDGVKLYSPRHAFHGMERKDFFCLSVPSDYDRWRGCFLSFWNFWPVGRSGLRVSAEDFPFLQNTKIVSGFHIASSSFDTAFLYREREVHSVPSSAEVMNEWSHTSATAICLYGVDKNTLHFFRFYKHCLSLCIIHLSQNGIVHLQAFNYWLAVPECDKLSR